MQPMTTDTPNGIGFRFSNIGPIIEADLELGDLTIIAGRNNTGKTYLVYTLYGFLKQWNSKYHYGIPMIEFARESVFGNISAKIRENGRACIAINRQTLIQERTKVVNALPTLLDFDSSALADIFNAPSTAFSQSSMKLHFGDKRSDDQHPDAFPTRQGDMFSIFYEKGQLRVIPSALAEKRYFPQIWGDLLLLYIHFLFPDLHMDPVVLSAERFGIALFYKELDLTKNQIVDMLQKMGDNKGKHRIDPLGLVHAASSRYALPIKDNITFTRSISDLMINRSEIYEDGIFRDIERIMRGRYESVNDDIQFITSSPDRSSLKIPLHRASSSARGLSDLYFFLRHVAQKNHLLIIDEPESHLDTANQVMMARLIARAVRAGLKVLLTTHSDYLVKEINNLVMLSNFGSEVAERVGYESSDRISVDSVRAYIAKGNSLVRCKIDRFGMEMPVFDDTIDKINYVANDLGSRLVVDQDD